MDDHIIPPKIKLEEYNYALNDDASLKQDKNLNSGDTTSKIPLNLSTLSKYTSKSIVPELRGLSMRKAMNTLNKNGFRYKIQGNGKVAWQSPKPGSIVNKETTCIIGMQ